MAIFGGGNQGPTQINTVQINQSVLGYAPPVGMGKFKVQQSLLWTDGYAATKVSASGGKGFGGVKGAYQYDYSADVIAALVQRKIAGIGDVWSGQSWLSLTAGTQTYTITGGSPSVPPKLVTKPRALDHGVSVVTSAGTAALQFVDNTPGSGQYSYDPPTGTYTFSSSDDGKTITATYSFPLGAIKKQEDTLVPSGLTVQVGGTLPFLADGGVVYRTNDANDGKPLQKVVGTPSSAGFYSLSGSAPATYTFASADVNKEVTITYEVDNSDALAAGTPTSLDFMTVEGDPGQAPLALLQSNYPGAALGYTGMALVAYTPMDLGFSASIQQNTFEVQTFDGWGGGIVDCSPVTCIREVLTNKVWGLGGGSVPFPLSAIDSLTWGTPGSTGSAVQDSTATSWFAANGFFISPLLTSQDTAASVISPWLEAGQCAAFMSEGRLKLVPYGDTTTTGNGRVWVAPGPYPTAITDDDFEQKSDNEDPVKISSTPYMDAYNVVQVQWSNRANQYANEITSESDQAAINRYGSRIEDPKSWDFIRVLPPAVFAASMRVKRNVYNRNTYEFSLSYRWSYLEPMDVVPITTSSAWSDGIENENLGVANFLVRITKTTDNPDGTIDFEAEDYTAIMQPTSYLKALSAARQSPNLFADPGDTTAVIFEASDRLTGYQGDQLWIGVSGASIDWGGCNVLVSSDGDKYTQIATITRPARLGVISAPLQLVADPDTTESLIVRLTPNSAPLESGTTADADLGNTLCYVGGEIVSYASCSISGQNTYTASGYLRRGQMGTTVAAHLSGAPFLRLDDAVFKYAYDPVWRGKPLFFKFQSVNVFGNSAQDVSVINGVSFTVPGTNQGAIDAATGNVLTLNGAVNDGEVTNLGGVSAADILAALRAANIIPPA